jgi:hypothetical protein
MLIGIGLAIVLLIVTPAIARRVADWMWYAEIGFERVFFTKIVAQWLLGGLAAILAFLLFFANARFALAPEPIQGEVPRRARSVPVIERALRMLALPSSRCSSRRSGGCSCSSCIAPPSAQPIPSSDATSATTSSYCRCSRRSSAI